MNHQTSFEFPADGAQPPLPVVRRARRRRDVSAGDAEAPCQLALVVSGDPIEVRLPVRVPPPPDEAAFETLVRSSRLVAEPAAPRRAGGRPLRSVSVTVRGRQWEVSLRLVPDEYEPHALLTAHDELGELIAEERVVADFRLTEAVARSWIEGDFQ
mgnify:FL=1